jgi:hypothetical protein
MGMSAWGLLALPLIAQTTEPGTTTIETTPSELAAAPADDAFDLFGDLSLMDEGAMMNASGGADTAFDIGTIGLNASETNGQIDETTVNNSQTGEIASNVISGNDGITFQVNNSGNGVIVQNTVNINIFTDGN